METLISQNDTFAHRYSRKRKRGFALFEFILVLGLAALLSVSIMVTWQSAADRIRAKGVADKLAVITEASKSYIKSNYTALQTLAPTSGALVIPTAKNSLASAIPTGPSGLPSLQSGGFLPSSFIDNNPFDQHTVLLVRKGSGTQLEAIVTTYGGRSIPDDMLGHAASVLGAIGGYVPTKYVNPAENGYVIGSYGGWRTLANTWGAAGTAPSAGHLQASLAFNDGALLADFLYRDNIGIPEANQMHTSIDMTGNKVNNVAALSAQNPTDTGAQNAQNTVEVDGNLKATIDIYARNANISNDVVAGNNVTASKDISAGQNLSAGNNLTVANNGTIGNDLTVNNHLSAKFLNTDAYVYSASATGDYVF